MILLNELKRIFTKAPILVLIAIIIPIFVISAVCTGVKTPSLPLVDLKTSDYREALANFDSGDPVIAYSKSVIDEPLDDLEKIIKSGDYDTTFLYEQFDTFARTWNEFLTLRQDDRALEVYLNELRGYFYTVNSSYIAFETEVNRLFSGASRMLITQDNYKILHKWMTDTAKIIEYDASIINVLSETALYQKRFGLQVPWDAYAHKSGVLEKHKVYLALHNSNSIKFTEEQKTTLLHIYSNQIIPNKNEIENQVHESQNYKESRIAISRYADYVRVSCDYLNENIRLMQNKNTKDIKRFQGFGTFNKAQTRDRMAVLEVIVLKGKASFDYSTPYAFGKVLHKGTGTTAYDFLFNNLELITIPLIAIACLIVMFSIFDDIRKNTVFATLLSPQGRRSTIVAKLLACTITIAAVITAFAFLFLASAAMITGNVAAPSVLLAFGGKAHMISPFTLLTVYMISLFFKILFFASVTALLCIDADSYKEVIVRTLFVIGAITALNLIFTVIVPLIFYQYLPFIGIDFAGSLGVKFMLSRYMASAFVWYTLPVMLIAWISIIVTAIVRFEKRDF